jgi:hypothetical protein
MELHRRNSSLVTLPRNIELILYLIREELKSSKLFLGLASAGFQDSCYQPNYCSAIIKYMGFEGFPDDLGDFYVERLEYYTKKISEDNDVIMKSVFNFYVDLVNQKRKERS